MADNPVWNVVAQEPTLRDHPAVAVSLAQSGASPAQVTTVASLTWTAAWTKHLSGLPDSLARQAWGQLNAGQQSLLTQSGYQPPDDSGDGGARGLFGWLGDKISDVAGELIPDVIEQPLKGAATATSHGISAAAGEVGHVVGQGLHYSAVPIHNVQRAYRTAHLISGDTGWGFSFDPDTWQQAWKDAGDPTKDYDKSRLAEVQSAYEPTTFTYAKRVSDGENPTDIIASLDSAGRSEEAAAVYQMFETDEFTRALRDIDGAHNSFGRNVAGGLGIDPEDKVWSAVSGLLDATQDIALDPILVGTKLRAAQKISHFGLDAADSSRRVAETFNYTDQLGRQPVREYWDAVGSHVGTLLGDAGNTQKGIAARALRKDYKVGELLPALTANRVTNADEAQTFFNNRDGFVHLLQGKSAIARPLMPMLSRRGEALISTKAAMRKPINWLEDGGKFVTDDVGAELAGKELEAWRRTFRGRIATFTTRLSTQTHQLRGGNRLYLDAADSPEQVHRLARTFAPDWFANQTVASYVAANEQGKRDILSGLMRTLGEASGMTQSGNKIGNEAIERWTRGQGLHSGTVFSPPRKDGSGVDMMPDGTRAAIDPEDLRSYVTLPSFRDMHAVAGRNGVLDRMVGYLDSTWMDWQTDRVFKPAVLLRPALVFRNAGEEVLNHWVRVGTVDYYKGRSGQRALRTLQAKQRMLDGAEAQAGRTFRAFTAGLTFPVRVMGRDTQQAARQQITNGKDWAFVHLHDRLRRFVPNHPTGGNDEAYLVDFVNNETNLRMVGRELNDSAILSARMSSHEDEIIQQGLTRGGRLQRQAIRPNGDYDVRGSDGMRGAMIWNAQLMKLSESPTLRIALRDIAHGQPKEATIAKLVEKIESPSLAAARNGSTAYKQTGAQGWAERMYEHTLIHVSDADGVVQDGVLDLIREGKDITAKRLSAANLNEIPEHARPRHLIGPDYLAVDNGASLFAGLVNDGFSIVGDGTAYLSRQPIFTSHYLRRRHQFANFEKELTAEIGEAEAKEWAVKAASESAIHDTLQYVDNPAIRSQASVLMRNLFPFWRAQEEFYRRWARTFYHSPESFRRLALIKEGFQHSGFVHKDDQGNDVFVYPGSKQMQQVMGAVGSIFGVNMAQLPVPYELQGQVRFLNQGLDPKNILPSGGPLLAVPLAALSSAFPNTWVPVEQAILGDQGAGKGVSGAVMSAFVPTPVLRALKYGIIPMIPGADESSYRASATKQAMAYLEYAGLTPPADASPAQVDAYQRMVENWSRNILTLRVIFGAFAPAAPEQMDISPAAGKAFEQEGVRSIKSEFYALVKKVGFERALALYMQVHPDGHPFTEPTTRSTSGAAVPATAQAGAYYQANKAFFDQHPDIAPFFMPQETGEFDQNTYRIQMANGLRESIPTDEFYAEMKVSGQLGFYFDQRDRYEASVEQARAAGNAAAVTQMNASWSQWKTGYFNSNPLVADYLAASGTRQRDRESKITALRRAVDSGTVPAGPTGQLFSEIIQGWDAHTAWQTQHSASLPGGRSADMVAARAAERSGFDQWLVAKIGDDPNGLMLYNKIFRYAEAS